MAQYTVFAPAGSLTLLLFEDDGSESSIDLVPMANSLLVAAQPVVDVSRDAVDPVLGEHGSGRVFGELESSDEVVFYRDGVIIDQSEGLWALSKSIHWALSKAVAGALAES